MAQEKSVTLTQIRLEQDHAEAQVMAQSALLGERSVALTRLAMMVMVWFSTALVPQLVGEPLPRSKLRLVFVGIYLFITILNVVVSQKVKKARPRVALWLPVLLTTIDSGFFLAMALIDHALGLGAKPEIVVATYAMLICFSVARFRVFHIVMATGMALVCVVGIAWVQGWFDPVWRISFIAACFLAQGFLIYRTNRRIREMMRDVRHRDNLSRLLPRQLVDRVLASGGSELQPVQREVTVLFSDIRNFTTMSEKMAPKEVLELLDGYFGHMGQIVRGHEGMLNKFLGDGLMAVWGVPEKQLDHAERALKAAVDMRRKLVEINEGRQREGIAPINIGIGVHTGIVAAGMLGGADQREYTVIGDAVNLCSRIEGLTKIVGCDILASETAWKQGGAKFSFERVGEEHVKGRAEGVVVYALKDPAAGHALKAG